MGEDTPQATSGARAPEAVRGAGTGVDNTWENEPGARSVNDLQRATIDTKQVAGKDCLWLCRERAMTRVAATASARPQ